jgi:hypothetical protein
MIPMIGAVISQGTLMAHQCQAMTHFELGCVKIWFSDFKPDQPKLTLLTAMTPISVAAKQFHITSMEPMISAVVSQGTLMAHQCQAMTHFELGCVK